MITPEWEPHRNLEDEVCCYMQQRGFLTKSFTYHGDRKDAFADELSRLYTPAALYLRGRADRSALHPGRKLVFEWEAKTHSPGRLHDGCFEATPLAAHLDRITLGVDCLYAYRDPYAGIECGFWVSGLPRPRCVMLPARYQRYPGTLEFLRATFRRVFPGVQLIDARSTRGTDDPFVIVPESSMRKLPDWRSLLDSADTPKPASSLVSLGDSLLAKAKKMGVEISCGADGLLYPSRPIPGSLRRLMIRHRDAVRASLMAALMRVWLAGENGFQHAATGVRSPGGLMRT